MGLSQYVSLGEYCDPHTASSVFLILVCIRKEINSELEIQLLISIGFGNGADSI